MVPEAKSLADFSRAFSAVWSADSIRGRFARGAAWSVVGAILSQGASLAASVITARLLGKILFGEYGIVQSTVGMLGVLAGMGLGLTATKYVAELRIGQQARAGRIIALSMVVAIASGTVALVILLLSAPWLAVHTLNAAHLSAELRIASGVLILNAVSGAQSGVLAGFEAFRALARVNLARGLITFPLAVGGVLWFGLPGAVAAMVAAAAAGCIVNHLAIRAECAANRIQIQWDRFWSERSVLWKFSLPALLGGAMVTPATWAASSILVNQPGGYAEMGIFNAANQWRTAVALLPSLLSQPLLPLLANIGTSNRKSFRKLLRANLLLTFGLSALVAAPIVVFRSWIMRAFGSDFVTGKSVLILLVLAAVISSTAAVIGQAIASLDKMWWAFALNLVWALALLSSSAFLVPRFGALGLSVAFLVSYSIHALNVGVYVRSHMGTVIS